METNQQWQVTQIDAATVQQTKDGAWLRKDGEAVPEDHSIVELSFKKTKANPNPPPPSYWLLPDVDAQVPMAVDEGCEQVALMAYDLLERARRAWLAKLAAGDESARELVVDVRAMAERHFLDGRSLGISQEEIETWISDVLAPALQRRIGRTLPTATADQRKNLVNSLLLQFQIAATRGNTITVKKSTITVTREALEDLRKRLELYVADGDLETCDELAALRGRIDRHLNPTDAQSVDKQAQW